MESEVKNQHFISQAEQRSNSANSEALKRNQVIYRFEVVDRDENIVRLFKEKGVKIQKALSFEDLFSFDVISKEKRLNLERFFECYESSACETIDEMIRGARVGWAAKRLEAVAMKVLTLKLMGMIRNPFRIKATLQLFACLRSVAPTAPSLVEEFSKIRMGVKPHARRILEEFGVELDDYVSWLEILYLSLVTDPRTGMVFLHSLVEALISSPGQACIMYLFEYNGDGRYSVLLSDVGYIQATSDPANNVFMFNLNKSTFVAFAMCDLIKQDFMAVPSVCRRFAEKGLGFSYKWYVNDEVMLKKYNSLCVFQSKSSVYCASSNIFGVNVSG